MPCLLYTSQHGTAIVVTAALINALRVVGKKMEDVHIVLNGPGAAGTAIIKDVYKRQVQYRADCWARPRLRQRKSR